MTALAVARNTVAQALAALGIPVHEYPPNTVAPPAAVVVWGSTLLDGRTMGGRRVVGLEVRLVVSAAAMPDAVARLEGLVETARHALIGAGIFVDPIPTPVHETEVAALTCVIPVRVNVEGA